MWDTKGDVKGNLKNVELSHKDVGPPKPKVKVKNLKEEHNGNKEA